MIPMMISCGVDEPEGAMPNRNFTDFNHREIQLGHQLIFLVVSR